jgi:hypothetical protein
MAEMIPVGDAYPPPNPNQGLSTLSGFLGLQQQQQQLQTQTAQAQQATAQNKALLAAQSFTQNAAKDPSFLNEDGTPNVGKYQQGLNAVGGIYIQPYLSQMTSNFHEAVNTRQAIQNLAAAQNETITKGLQGLANIPGGATKTDVINWKDQVESNNKDPGLHRALENLTLSMQPDSNGGYSGAAAKAAAFIGGLSMQAPGTINLAGGVQPITTTTMGPNIGQVAPTGPVIKNVLGPTDTPEYKAQVAYQQGQATSFASRQSAGIETANQSPAALDALSRARAILDQGTWTGSEFSLFKELKNALAGVGIDTQSATNANELVKNMARYEATRANTVGNTDASRSLVAMGSPNTAIDAQAAKNIVTQSMANEMAIKGYAQNVGRAANVQEGMSKEGAFRSIPNLVEGYEYGLMRSPQEADQFLKRYGLTKQQVAATRAQMRQEGLL